MRRAVRIRTNDGSAYVVDGSFSELEEMVVDAIKASALFIRVRNGRGQMRSISLTSIAALEELGEDFRLGRGEVAVVAVRDADPRGAAS